MKPGTEVQLTQPAAKCRQPEMWKRTGTVISQEGEEFVRVKWNGSKEIWTERKENLEVYGK